MKKLKHQIKFGAIGATTATILALPLALTSVAANSRLVYQNRIFENIDEAVDDYLSGQSSNIRSQKVVGSLAEATIDSQFNLLRRNSLYDYNPNKISPAYVTRYGTFTSDARQAANSHASLLNSRSQYTYTGALTNYDTLQEAEAARDSLTKLQTVGLAKLSDPTKALENSPLYLNPTNAADLNNLESLVLAAIRANNNGALREMEKDYESVKGVNAKLGTGWSIKPFYRNAARVATNPTVVGTPLNYLAIDDVSGSHLGSELDFSNWSTQFDWIRGDSNIDASNYVDTKYFENSGVYLTITKDGAVLQGTMGALLDQSSNDETQPYVEWVDEEDWHPVEFNDRLTFKLQLGETKIEQSITEPSRSDRHEVRNFGAAYTLYGFDWDSKTNLESLYKTTNSEWLASNNRQYALNDLVGSSGDKSSYNFGKAEMTLTSGLDDARSVSTAKIDGAIARGVGKALNNFLNEVRGNNDTNSGRVDIESLLGNKRNFPNSQQKAINGVSAGVDPGLGGALVSKNQSSRIYLKSDNMLVFKHRFGDIRSGALGRYFHQMGTERLEGLGFSVPLATLFNPLLSGTPLYKIRLDLAKKHQGLTKIVTYNGVPLFKVSEDDAKVVTLERLNLTTKLTNNVLELNTFLPEADSGAGQLKALYNAISAATTTTEKIATLLRSNAINIDSISLLRKSAQLKSHQFGFDGEGVKPYLQYLAALRSALLSAASGAESRDDINARQKLIWENNFLSPGDFMLFNGIDYFLGVSYGESFNEPSFGLQVNQSLVPFRLSDTEFILNRDQVLRSTVPAISTTFVFYDIYAQPILLKAAPTRFDNALYDSLALMRENILREYPLEISTKRLYVTDAAGEQKLVSSQISTIYEFKSGDKLLYFASFKDLKNYVKAQIEQNSTLI